MGKVEYEHTIKPTKFDNCYDLAEFLAKSIWWEREFDGLKYDKKEWNEIVAKVIEEEKERSRKDLFFFNRMREKYFQPFWEKQLKENYNFPLYFGRECTYADGRSTYYKCTVYNRDEYINILEKDIERYENQIKKIRELQKNA